MLAQWLVLGRRQVLERILCEAAPAGGSRVAVAVGVAVVLAVVGTRCAASVLVCPLGYRHSDDKYANQTKVRYPKSEVIAHLP